MFLSQNHGQKALVLLKNGKCGYMSSGNHCLAVVAGQLQLLPYVPSNLAASSVTSWAELRYWLTARSKTMKSNISHVKPIVHAPPVLVCVVHTHPGEGPPLAHHVWSCKQSHQPGLQGACQPSALSCDGLLFRSCSMVRLLLPPQLSASGGQDFTPGKGGKKQEKQ